MTIDLETMSREELLKLRSDLDKAISTVADRERRAAIEAAERAVAQHGFTLAQLTGVSITKGRTARGAVNPAKYRNPADASQTWSGRGRRPEWVNNALAEGKGLADLAI